MKSINQMNVSELRAQETYYSDRTDHVARLMMARIREALAIRTK